jgi:AcrR family transcriptional regulator
MSISLHADARTNTILNAALTVFARYGFKRASMEDIAREAGVSRPALYLVFANKGAIFSALAQAMAVRACTGATTAWPADARFQDGLAGAGVALYLDAWRLIKGSPHGSELLSDNSVVVGEISASVDAHFIALIRERLSQNGQSTDMAKTIAAALHGIKDKATSEVELLTATVAFSKMVAASFGMTA